MSYLAENFVMTFDPLGHGHGSPDHLELGYRASRGIAFPSVAGVILLARRRLYPEPEGWRYCGQAHASGGVVRNAPGFGHEAGMGYQYAAAHCRGNGFRSAFGEPTRIDLDDNGDLITPRLPVWPNDINAVAIAGGKFSVRWSYDPYGQGDYPADFQVFGGPDAENIDYQTPLTDSETGLSYVLYIHGQRQYQFTTAAYDDLVQQVFAVRGRNSEAVAEKNMYTTATVRARSASPSAASVYRIWQRRQ
jgi:hypothetical protein